MGTAIFQIIFTLMIIGAISALVLKLLRMALGCLLLGVGTVLIGAVLYWVLQALSWLSHLFV
jgi:hypothetical protein